jgi:hypothetical protein
MLQPEVCNVNKFVLRDVNHTVPYLFIYSLRDDAISSSESAVSDYRAITE